MFRFEYDRVIGFHPYRTHQPWDRGGIRLLQVDGVNCSNEEHVHIQAMLRALESKLCQEARDEGFRAEFDNHYGFTVVSEGARDSEPKIVYQLRFSDGSLYVWLMPVMELTISDMGPLIRS